MDEFVTLAEQHLDGQPLTVVTQGIGWWEAAFALVKPQEHGLGGYLPVNVCCHLTLSIKKDICTSSVYLAFNSCELWHSN